MTRVAVMGAGAVGSYLGSRFAAAQADVHLIARGAHLAALRDKGLTLITPDGVSTTPVWATDDPASIGPVDIVLFCVKSYDTEDAVSQLPPLVGPQTAVISIQNGIENEAKIAAGIGAEHVLGAATYILAAIESPGVIRSGAARIVIGEMHEGRPSERVTRPVSAGASRICIGVCSSGPEIGPTNAKSCEPEGPQDLTGGTLTRPPAAVKREPSGAEVAANGRA